MKNLNHLLIRKEIGKRFKQFREALNKTQAQMADELGIYQSTITNIEVGKTFPGIKYIHYFHKEYNLNDNWLLNNSGELFISEEEKKALPPSRINCHVLRDNPTYAQYVEMMELMKIPVIEQVILAKLAEMKVIAKEEITAFFKQEEKTGETPKPKPTTKRKK
jgi:transcriptional regulator with XRE-family HTH domain